MSAPTAARPASFTDPVKLHQAARIVRASLARQGLTLADLVPADSTADNAARTGRDTERRAAA